MSHDRSLHRGSHVHPFPSEKIRNLALVGHQGAGKTTLAEAILYRAGAIARQGRVEDGTTTCDWAPEEQQRGSTLSLSLAPCEWRDHKINLLDTPGFGEFDGEVEAALEVADLAVFVVSGTDGVEVRTEAIWRHAEGLGIPRLVFVNQLDRERASFERCLDELRERFGAGIAPLELPFLEGTDLRGVLDLLRDEAVTYEGGRGVAAPIPDLLATAEHEVHDQLVEGIVVGDDSLLERYLDGVVPSFEELEAALAKGVVASKVFPVLCGSAVTGVGVDRLVDFVCEIGPSPLDRPPVRVRAGDQEVEIAPHADDQSLAHVFKTISDPHVGRISLLKVDAGTLHPDDHLVNSRTGGDERLHGLTTVRGREHEPVEEVTAGDLAAVSKLADTATGDTLAPRGKPVEVVQHPVAQPVYWVAVTAASRSDDDKLPTALHRLVEEDPSLHVVVDPDTHQTLLAGAGETHIAVAVERMQRRFGVEVVTEPARVPYRETVTQTASAEGRYKKQSGGHGQFGVVVLRLEPRPAGSGLEFLDEVVGGAIPRQYVAAVRRGVEEAMAEGGVLGHPVVDLAVACVDGKHHPVDSSEMSFKMAGRLAFRAAEELAAPILLEPISRLVVRVPADAQGDVLSDLNARRGRVLATEPSADGDYEITALVPRAETQRYAMDLRAITGGRGSFRIAHEGYESVPQGHAAVLAQPPAQVG